MDGVMPRRARVEAQRVEDYEDAVLAYDITILDTDDSEYKENITELRARIDSCDDALLRILGSRMQVSRKIGRYKKENNSAIIQAARWDSLLEQVYKTADIYDLDHEFIAKVFNAIHEASVQEQNKILSE